MFKQPTVIVVGAGASKDLEFPLGDELRYKISDLFKRVRTENFALTGPQDVLDAIRSHATESGSNINEYLAAARVLSKHIMYARSIDEFVDHHNENTILVFLAKIGICQTILKYESESKLFVKGPQSNELLVNHAFLDQKDVWLKQLWYMMREGVPRHDPQRIFDNLSIINFNYDRTLEVFLLRALCDMFDLTSRNAADLIEAASIFHPYGLVDRLSVDSASGTVFGGSERVDLKRLCNNIRTYCESEISETKVAFGINLRNARNVVFLGFAYRQLNLELLKIVGYGSVSVFGTAVGIPDENFPGIEGRLGGVFERTNGVVHTRLRGVKSAELLRLTEEFLIG